MLVFQALLDDLSVLIEAELLVQALPSWTW